MPCRACWPKAAASACGASRVWRSRATRTDRNEPSTRVRERHLARSGRDPGNMFHAASWHWRRRRARFPEAMEVFVKFIRSGLTVALLCSCTGALAAPADFTIDAVHSQIFFSASHDGYTNPTGRLHVKQGTFRFDADDWSRAQVNATIDISSIDMGDAPWNAKLLGAFFDVTRYPTAHFVSTRVEKTGDRRAVIHGNLTLLDKTRPVDLQVTFNRAAVN